MKDKTKQESVEATFLTVVLAILPENRADDLFLY